MTLETFLHAVHFSYAVSFNRRKTKKKYQKSQENMSLKTYFWYLKL